MLGAVCDARWSEERLYTALRMGGALPIVMLAFMWGMHKDIRASR